MTFRLVDEQGRSLDAFKISNKQRAKVDGGQQRRTPELLRVELCAYSFDEEIEVFRLQQFTKIKAPSF